MERLANYLFFYLKQNELIPPDQDGQYYYALLTLTERMVVIISLIALGCYMRQILKLSVFFVCFCILRKHTGGYHANTFKLCYILTMVTLVAAVYIIDWLSIQNGVRTTMIVVSTIYVYIVGTINHPNMDMTEDELAASKKATRYTLSAILFIYFATVFLSINKIIGSSISAAIILCATLMCVSKIIKQEVKK